MNAIELNECVAAAARLRAAGVITVRTAATPAPTATPRKPGKLRRRQMERLARWRKVQTQAGYLPQKVWLEQEAARLGLVTATLLDRINKTQCWPPKRRFNTTIVYVKNVPVSPTASTGRAPKYDWSTELRRRFAGQPARLHRIYMRVWRGTMTLNQALALN